ncbi:hypothetical protein RchiOBHm_Chr2g0129011 [Rosa chinensis]|uniref:Uncharacterized protein n=1 Tax=Rosa chinensis TaxID=74649 RepID=A0A2P6RUG0_ROSCH|nr:hypothetical protein RchiOBHm_Chr2g0129011 [Rosa chinensis]
MALQQRVLIRLQGANKMTSKRSNETSWVVIAILLGSAIIAVRNPQTIPTDGQNFFEYVLEFL